MSPDIKDSGIGPKRTQKPIDAVGQFPSFFSNEHHAYVARKAERLASAVHVVTGFVAREEPIRTLLRSSSLEVVQLATDLSRLGDSGPDAFAARAAEICTMLETAEVAGLVSAMNAKLIVDEYAALATFIRERYSVIRSRGHSLSDNLLGQYKGQKDTQGYRTHIRAHESDKGQMNSSSRRADILALFNDKDKISIKDASQAVPGVSEKTLQRELLAMVSDGVLLKEGERRWSTYRKATVPQSGSFVG